MDTNPNISRLLEMLDNPSAYSEQEILDCIHSDEETLAAYRLMAAAKQAYRLKQTQQPADVEEAWQRLMREASNNPSAEDDEMKNQASSKTSRLILHSSFKKIAAIFLAVAFLGGLAWAFAPLLHFHQTADSSQPIKVSAPSLTGRAGGESSEGASLLSFSNLPLDSILCIISAHYGRAVCFRDTALQALRLSTVWDSEDSLAVFLGTLNEFDGLRLTDERDTIFVESVAGEEE